MNSLTKKQLAYLKASTADIKIRPTLANIFYDAKNKCYVSTDSFRMHVLYVDQGEENFWIDTNGNRVTKDTGFRFPAYTSFFADQSHSWLPIVKFPKHLKAFDQLIISADKEEFKTTGYDGGITNKKSRSTLPFTFSVNPNYLQATIKDMKSALGSLGKTNLAPIIITGDIDNKGCKALLMPLKLN